MGLISTLLGTQQKVQFIQSTTGTVISIDCTIQETHERESPPTEFPIESGETVSDHMIVKPFSLKINGLISDTPIKVLNSALTTFAAAPLPASGVIGVGAGLALYNALQSSTSPSVAAYAQLLSLQENKKPFTVVTTLRRYDSMWIKSISVPRDNGTGRALIFTVDLVQLLLVQPQTVNIAIFADSDLSASEANLGKQEMENPILQKFKQGQKAFTSIVGESP